MWQQLGPACECVLDIVFPPRCAGCGDWHKGVFCPACRGSLRPIVAPMCGVCGAPFDPLAKAADTCADCRDNRYHKAPPLTCARSLYLFEGPAREAIYHLKYHGKTALARPLAGLCHDYLLRQEGARVIPHDRLALIAPVPLHPWRRYRRGYNQSALLARELARQLDTPTGEVLRRTRYTPSQVGLRLKARVANVHGAFDLRQPAWERLNPQRGPVLLVDDVYTTGATLRECARVLRASGVEEVYGLALARQLPAWALPENSSQNA